MELSDWLLHQVTEANPAGRCIRIAAYLVQANGSIGTEVIGFTVPEDVDSRWVAEQTKTIEEHTQADANSMGGTQRYQIVCYFAERPSVPGARRTIRVFGAEVDNGGGEPANATGLLAELMRHLDNKERTGAQAMLHVLATVERRMDSLSEENESLRLERIRTFELAETVLTASHERALETKKAEAKIELFKESAGKVRDLVPQIVNHLAGQKILPEVSQTSQMASLMRSLTPEQLEQIAGSLNPMQLEQFLQMIRPMIPDETSDPKPH